MAAALRKIAENHYVASGSLAALRDPGRRIVRRLGIRNPDPGDDLSSLAAFPDLAELELEHIHDVDISALAGLKLRTLAIWDCSSVDLDVLGELPALEVLRIGNVRDVAIRRLPLARSLAGLAIINDDPALNGQPVARALKAIDWQALGRLQSLTVRVGGLYELPPIDVDLSFLRSLPALNHLMLAPGVHHHGPQPSPLEPPIDGLSKQLSYVEAEVTDPDAVQSALRGYLGPDAGLSIKPRRAVRAPARPWSLKALPDGEGWHTYGSLLRAEGGTLDDTEYDALRRAKGRLRAADRRLLARLEFDPENAGTGIMAPSREDLTRALELLGLKD
jgi:hypothetical protein